MIPKFTAYVEQGGKLKLHNRQAYEEYVYELAGKIVSVTVAPRKAARSNQQNRYYWGVVVKLLTESIGMAAEDVHNALKYHYLGESPSEKAPILARCRAKSSTSLTTKEFAEFVDQVIADAADGSLTGAPVMIPLPNEVDGF
jgi:hypothetical protein